MDNTINGRTSEEIKKGMEYCLPRYESKHWVSCSSECPFRNEGAYCRNVLNKCVKMYIRRLERERDAAVRTARWQFERRSDGSVTELPVCSGCGATPKYYASKNDVGMQVPPYCHECGSKMEAAVKMEVE